MSLPALTEIGRFGKPHGIAGEIAASVDVDPEALSCIFVEMDGIMVPFFISSSRPKGNDTVLMKIDGYDDEKEVKVFSHKPFFAPASEVGSLPGDGADVDPDDEDGLYASDLIGFTAARSDGEPLGEITDIDDNTANVLFVITPPDGGRQLLVPVADEFITAIDPGAKRITLDLPAGILDL